MLVFSLNTITNNKLLIAVHINFVHLFSAILYRIPVNDIKSVGF